MRDDFTADVKKAIAHRANLICSNPDCRANTGGPQLDTEKALNVGVAAHIAAAAPGGQRYRPEMTPEERSSASNGIWLCQTCAKKIDNDSSLYTEQYLKAWKTIREHDAFHSIGKARPEPIESESEKKRRELIKWVGKTVVVVNMRSGRNAELLGARASAALAITVVECSDFYVRVMSQGWDRTQSIPYENLKFGWDDRMQCLEILRYDT